MANTQNKLHLIFGDATFGVGGNDFHYIFSYERGGIESLVSHGKEWLYRTPMPTFWRATTDNDRGSGFSVKSAQWYAADMFSTCKNVELTIDGKTLPQLPIAPETNQYSNQEFANEATITFIYATNTIPSTEVSVSYTVHTSGKIDVTVHFVGNEQLPDLPALGMRFIMPTKATSFDYEGLSGETYPDRMAGASEGKFHVTGLPVTPYIVTQECGMHMETSQLQINRNSTLNNADNDPVDFSLKIQSKSKKFAFSCLPYTAEELENATHIEELPPARRTVLSIFGEVRGVGGIDSWGTDVESQYHISAKTDHIFDFSIVPSF